MPGSPVPCAVWVPQVGEVTSYSQVSSLLIPALSFPPPPPFSLSLFKSEHEETCVWKSSMLIREKCILQKAIYECR